MATTITTGSTVITPEIITAWNTAQETRNVIHDIIGRQDPDVTLQPASTRNGTLEMVFTNSSDAETARNAFVNGTTFLIESDLTWLDGLTVVMNGSISAALEDTTRNLWTISADFVEVTP
jgi:hypothetical protein